MLFPKVQPLRLFSFGGDFWFKAALSMPHGCGRGSNEAICLLHHFLAFLCDFLSALLPV
jgi:hypothetical protein